MTTIADVQREVDQRVEGSRATVLERLAQRFGGFASAAAVYGAPVERDGVTVIPVASVRLGFGAGGDLKEGREGGGGGAAISPVGYIEIRDGMVAFRRIRNPERQMLAAIPVLIAGTVTTWLMLRSLRGARRAAEARGLRRRRP